MNLLKPITSLILGLSLYLACAASQAAALDAFWSHGNTASLESPTNVTMNKFGWGAVYRVPFGAGAWTHVTLPTPVIEDGVRSKLYKVLVQYNGTAVIDKVDVWDGPNRIATVPVNWTGNHLGFGNWGTVFIPNFPQTLYGISVSLHMKNPCAFVLLCGARSMHIAAVGGDFYN